MREVTVYVGLGANAGDRLANIARAVERLGAVAGVRVLRRSQLLESELVGDGPPQAPFLNGVVELATTLPAPALLAVCKALEAEAGRRLPAPRNHPRPLDLDLLLYGDARIDTRDLVVPHPRLRERDFVTVPLRELGVDPDAVAAPARPDVVADPDAFAARCRDLVAGGCRLGLVPTMGALHDGHASLFDAARACCDRVVATIFVNPLQFGPNEDFAAYPRDLDGDLAVCRAHGVDVVFAPAPERMYRPGFCSNVAVGREAATMEGAVRDGHFAGVATVVARLFALSQAHRAYFGRKDAQQVAVVRRMAGDLGFPVEIVECPIVREADGLAKSSRNVYLGAADRRAGTVLIRALRAARAAFERGERDRDALLAVAGEVLRGEPRAALDYLELRAEADLQPLPAGRLARGRMLVAARFTAGAQPVRLLDNLSLDVADEPRPTGREGATGAGAAR